MNPDRAEQIRAADELLFAGPQKLGIAKGLYLGRFISDWVMPYPSMTPDQQNRLDAVMPALRQFLDDNLDPAAIDREADIPKNVIQGLAGLGILGLAAPVETGGRGFSQ